MDVATHALVPLAAALALLAGWSRDVPREKLAWAWTFGLAGAAPDLDGLWDWASVLWDSMYPFAHRGASHTLWGSATLGVGVLGILALLGRRWPKRFGLFQWRRPLVVAAALGATTHLVLDGITYGGVPLLWPFVEGRFFFPLYHWLIIWLLPVSLAAIVVSAWRRDPRIAVAGGAVVVAAILVLGGIRLAGRPDAPEGGYVFPSRSEWSWTVVEPAPDGWFAYEVRAGSEVGQRMHFWDADAPAGGLPAEAWLAVERARSTAAYHGFRMGLFGPEAVQAVALPSGGWNVTFVAVAQRFEALGDPQWTPTMPVEDWGYVSFDVGASVRTTHRGY